MKATQALNWLIKLYHSFFIMVSNMGKPLVKTFIIKLFVRINLFKKIYLPFSAIFFNQNMIQSTPHLRELSLTVKIARLHICITSA